MILLKHYITHPTLHFITHSNLQKIFNTITLFLIFNFNLLLKKINLSITINTFLTNILLTNSKYHHTLKNNIKPFKNLLLKLFFININISINFNTLLKNPLHIIILLLNFLIIKITIL